MHDLHDFCKLPKIPIYEEIFQAHIKYIYNDDKILQSHQDNIFVCNTDEGQLVRDIIT